MPTPKVQWVKENGLDVSVMAVNLAKVGDIRDPRVSLKQTFIARSSPPLPLQRQSWAQLPRSFAVFCNRYLRPSRMQSSLRRLPTVALGYLLKSMKC